MRAPSLRYQLVIAAIGILILLPSPSSGIELQMRLSSGLWRMKLDEVNSALAGWATVVKRSADLDPAAKFISGEAGRLRLGVDFEAELILSFSRWIKLGLSAGYEHVSLDEKATLLTVEQSSVLYERACPTKVSAYPFLVSGYFNIPLGRKFGVYLRAGVGAIQAKYISREALKKATDTSFTYPSYDNAGARRLTYLGGLGLSYSFDPMLGFFIEGDGRFARVSGLTGESLLTPKGTLYAYDEYVPQARFSRPTMHVRQQAPSAWNIRNVHEAMVDLSGYSVKMGLVLKF